MRSSRCPRPSLNQITLTDRVAVARTFAARTLTPIATFRRKGRENSSTMAGKMPALKLVKEAVVVEVDEEAKGTTTKTGAMMTTLASKRKRRSKAITTTLEVVVVVVAVAAASGEETTIG